MSKISLAPDVAGTGIFTIASPNSNTNRTLTLPDDTGTIVTNSGNQAGSFTTLNTSGAVVFNDAGADVDFRVEGDTDANLLFVDAGNDRVGIGTASPDGRLHVHNGTAGSVTAQSNADDLTVENNANAGISILSPDANVASIYFGSPASAFNAQIESGYNAGAPYIKFNTSAQERMRIDSSGNLLVGTTSAGDGKLRISASANAFNILKIDDTGSTGGNYIQFLNSAGAQAGSINHNGTTSVNYGSGSDYRLKENIAPMTGALAKVLELNPVTYTWKADGSAGEGFIAHELQELCPDAVVGEKDATEIQRVEVSAAVPATYDEEGNELTPAVEAVYEEREVPKYQTVDTSFLVATLTAAIQELKAELDEAKARIAALETGA